MSWLASQAAASFSMAVRRRLFQPSLALAHTT
jgi:hypothetical protein